MVLVDGYHAAGMEAAHSNIFQDSLQNCRSSVRFGSAHKIHFLEVKEMFMQSLENHLNECNNHSVTENGAVGYKSTGKALLDLNFLTSSLRSANEQTIISKFDAALQELSLIHI